MAKNDELDLSMFEDIESEETIAPSAEVAPSSNDLDLSMFADIPMEEEQIVSPSFAAEEKEPSVSELEAGILGFGEGASFGLTPILSGVTAAGMEAVEDVGDILGLTESAKLREQGFKIEDEREGLSGLLDEYYAGRDRQKAAQAKAMEEQFGSYIGGLVGGSLAGVGAAGAAAKGLSGAGKIGQIAAKALPIAENTKGLKLGQAMGRTALEGLKGGALAGFGGGESKLLEGEAGKTLEEVGVHALGGAALGGALSGAGRAIGGLKSIVDESRVGTAYRYGKKGKKLIKEQVNDDIHTLSRHIARTISKDLKKAGIKKGDILEASEIIAKDVANGKSLKNAFEDTMNNIRRMDVMNDSEFAKVKEGVLDYFDELRGNPKVLKKLDRQIEKARLNTTKQNVEAAADKKMQKQAEQRIAKGQDVPDDVDVYTKGSMTQPFDDIKTRVRREKFKVPGESPEEDKIIEKVTAADVTDPGTVATKAQIDPKTGRPFVKIKDMSTEQVKLKVEDPLGYKITDIDNMTVKDIDNAIKSINKQTKLIEGQGPKILAQDEGIKAQSQMLTTELKKIQEQMIAQENLIRGTEFDLTGANKTFSGLKEAMDVLGLDTKGVGSLKRRTQENVKKLEQLIASGSDNARIDQRNFLSNLEDVNPQYKERFETLMNELKELKDLTKEVSLASGISPTGAIRELAGGVEKGVAKIAGFAGRGTRGAKKQWQDTVSYGTEKLKNLSPGSYDLLGEMFNKMGHSDFGNAIRSLQNEPEQTKTALLYSLYQQPTFRDLMHEVGMWMVEKDEE